jgi:predicted MFS family arabinose efflux permease
MADAQLSTDEPRNALTDDVRRVPLAKKRPLDDLPPSMSTLVLFAVACGLSVANVYFAQPLLDAIGAAFGIAPARMGMIVTATQAGYALGLVFVVPLGDMVDRRRLVVLQIVGSALALVVVATAHSTFVLLGGLFVLGLSAVLIQVLVAFTASISPAAHRGKSVGIVTSGIVIGILLARFFAGALADMGGWRTVYRVSAVATFVMALLLLRRLPRDGARERPVAAQNYGVLLRSMPVLFWKEPILRTRALLAFFIFATFSALWTPLVLPLTAPPHSLSHFQVGAFGIAGLAGALAAGVAGKLADRGEGQRTTGFALALLVVSWLLIAALPVSLVSLGAGIVILDFAVQAVHVTNQSFIFAARPDAGSRGVAGYMVFYSAGSAVGSMCSTLAYANAGWSGVCALGAALGLLGFVGWAATATRRHVPGEISTQGAKVPDQ